MNILNNRVPARWNRERNANGSRGRGNGILDASMLDIRRAKFEIPRNGAALQNLDIALRF